MALGACIFHLVPGNADKLGEAPSFKLISFHLDIAVNDLFNAIMLSAEISE